MIVKLENKAMTFASKIFENSRGMSTGKYISDLDTRVNYIYYKTKIYLQLWEPTHVPIYDITYWRLDTEEDEYTLFDAIEDANDDSDKFFESWHDRVNINNRREKLESI
jgi:hypothetical protein